MTQHQTILPMVSSLTQHFQEHCDGKTSESAAETLRVCLEYRVLPGFEPGTSAWPGRGPPELRTRCALTETTSGKDTTDGFLA